MTLYLDATKSRMLFARRLILVEGIAEQTLIPRLFTIHHGGKKTLESVGATVVNVSGVAFRHFLTVVRNGLHLRCVTITDQDSKTQCSERAQNLKKDFDTPNLIEVCITRESTFEKDIIAANKTGKGKDLLIKALQATKPLVGKAMMTATSGMPLDVDSFFSKIEDVKAEFAFNLASQVERADCGLTVPPYIVSAFECLG